MRIEWTFAAQTDLRQIHAYISRDSRVYAARMIARIRQSVETMSLFPESGSAVPEFEERELREIFVQNYRIIYRIEERGLTILTIIHGARNLPDVFHPP